MAWRVVGRFCRPNIDTFFAVMLFGVGGTLLTVLWTFESKSVDPRAIEAEVQRQLVGELLELRKNDHTASDSVWDRPLGSSRRATTKSPKQAAPKRLDTGKNDKQPRTVLRNTDRTRAPKRTVELSVNQSVASRSADGGQEGIRTLPTKSSDDDFLQKVRLKLLNNLTSNERVLRPTQRSNARLVHGRNESQRWCSVYNTTPEVGESFDCIRMLIKPPTTVCLYPDPVDSHVSRHLRKDGLWEPHIIRLFQNLLYQNPDLGVVDIGAHIGQYSLLAAVMGRHVVAVEPHRPNLRRLHKAIHINDVQKQIVVVENAVSDVRGAFQLGVPPDNQGGAYVRREAGQVDAGTPRPCEHDRVCPSNVSTIVMDDLLEVVDFRHVVMKIDIEGHERRAFFHADKLFDGVNVRYIFMEWLKLRAMYGAEVDDTEDKRLVQRLVDWLTRRGYTAHSVILVKKLNPDYWYTWPDDIFWQHRDADPFL